MNEKEILQQRIDSTEESIDLSTMRTMWKADAHELMHLLQVIATNQVVIMEILKNHLQK